MSQDRKQLHATLMAIPYYSNDRPPDDPQVRFLETPAANGVAGDQRDQDLVLSGQLGRPRIHLAARQADALATRTGSRC